MEMKKLAHEVDMDDDFQMDWLSPKRLAELREERKRNPPSQEELDKVQAFWNKLMEEQEQARLRRKKSGKKTGTAMPTGNRMQLTTRRRCGQLRTIRR